MADLSRHKITYLVRDQGWRFRDIDKKYHLKTPSNMVLHRPHPQAEKIISEIIGIPAHKIWPSRYDSEGKRLRPQPSKNYNSHTVSQCHRQKAKIA